MPVSLLNRRLLPELGLPTRRTSARSACSAIAVRRAEHDVRGDVDLERERGSGNGVDARAAERSPTHAPHLVPVDEPELAQPPAHLRPELGPKAVDACPGPERQLCQVPHGPLYIESDSQSR